MSVLLALGGCGSTATKSSFAGPPPLTQLRIAVAQPGKDCASDGANWSPEARGYVRHLTERMGVPVQLCPVADKASAARAVAEGKADLALLDPASYASFKAQLRPILTPRLPMDVGRAEIVVAAAAASPVKRLSEAGRATLVFGGSSVPRFDGPRRTLVSAGFAEADLAKARTVAGPSEVAALLHSTPGLIGVFLSADWSRLCRGQEKRDRPCTGLREIWRGRPQAATAWVVRRDIPPESWARLVGIHVALFEEQPQVARWLAPGTREIEPTEATALDIARPGV